ncbi:LysR family transcriptional regulator [Kibdelosporangium lantanae]
MESRPLRYFLAVADELNFARAADRLGISPPPLSRAIRQLETELGVTLFERTTHQVTLTPAGHVLLEQARTALDALDAAARRTQRAAAAEPKVVLAVKADSDAGLLDQILARYAADPAALPVAVRLCGWGEQPGLLRRGEADVALVHEWFDATGLDTELVAVEASVAALPAAHPLAREAGVHMADLGLPTHPRDIHQHLSRVVREYDIRDLSQLLKLVELGEFTTVLPESVVTRYPRSGVAYVPVVDATPVRLVVAWPQQSRSTATAALVRAAVSSGSAGGYDRA